MSPREFLNKIFSDNLAGPESLFISFWWNDNLEIFNDLSSVDILDSVEDLSCDSETAWNDSRGIA